MKNSRRVLALLGVVFLILLYLSTFVFALLDAPVFQNLLKASVAATILIPIFIYVFLLFCRLTDRRDDDSQD